jgi:P2 family phage contractile tail tube protein
MAGRDIRKNLNLFVQGLGYAGEIEDFNAPKLTLKTEDFRAGGMNAPKKLNMGLDLLDTSFSLTAYDPDVIALFGLQAGASVSLIAREVLEDFDSTVTPVVHTMQGTVTEFDPGSSKAGTLAPIKITVNLTYYKLDHGTQTLHEIDVDNMIQFVNGVDQMAAQRAALGM